MEIELNNKFN